MDTYDSCFKLKLLNNKKSFFFFPCSVETYENDRFSTTKIIIWRSFNFINALQQKECESFICFLPFAGRPSNSIMATQVKFFFEKKFMVSKWKVYFRIIRSADDDTSAFPKFSCQVSTERYYRWGGVIRNKWKKIMKIICGQKRQKKIFRYYQTIQEQKLFCLLVFIGSVWIGPRFEVQPRTYSIVFFFFFF